MTKQKERDSAMVSDELKPCPFCGGKPEIIKRKIYGGETTWADGLGSPGPIYHDECFIRCSVCKARMDESWPPDMEVRWNRRTSERREDGASLSPRVPPSDEVVEAVARAIFENAEHRCSWADADKYFFKLDGQKTSDFYKVMGNAAIEAYQKATGIEGWRPIETAPKQKVILLWAITDTELPNWKMATGCWMPGYRDEPGQWEWDGRKLKPYDVQPTHWQPLPSPPAIEPRAEKP